MTMVDRALYGYEIGDALGGYVQLLSADQTYDLRGPLLAVCNTSDSDTQGSHWIAICIDGQRRGEVFDSFGMHPAVYGLTDVMQNTHTWRYNDVCLQNHGTAVCGYYAIGYCRAKMRGISMLEYLSMFTKDTLLNDIAIYRWITDDNIL